MIELKQTNKNLALSNKQYLKGDDGGYYIPAIDAEGNLTWMPTVEDMPIPDAANIRGPIGVTGAPGKDGRDGINGKDGYTPIKGVDYFDGAPGKDGEDGANGKDGYTPVKGVDYFDGEPGPAGEDGKDYVLTEADKREIAGMVEVPEGGGGSGDTIYWEGTLDAAETQKALSSEEVAKLLEASNKDVSITLKNHDDDSEITFTAYASYDAFSGEVEFQGVDEASNNLLVYLYLYTDSNMFDYALGLDSQADIKIFLPAEKDYYTKEEVDEKISEIDVDVDLTGYYTKEEIDELLANLPSGGGDIPSGEEVGF